MFFCSTLSELHELSLMEGRWGDRRVVVAQWEKAVRLAEKGGKNEDVGKILGQYSSRLVETRQYSQALALYRRVGHNADAAKLLSKLAGDDMKMDGDLIRAKKLYVLAALEVDRYKRSALSLDGEMTRKVGQ